MARMRSSGAGRRRASTDSRNGPWAPGAEALPTSSWSLHTSRAGRPPGRRQERREADVAAHEVVEAPAGDEVLFQAHQRGRLGIVEADLEIEHLGGVQGRIDPFQVVEEDASKGDALPVGRLEQEGRQFLLGVDAFFLVGLPVQMDGQAGDDGHRLPEIAQNAPDRSGGGEDRHPPRQGQVTVEPGVEECPAVDLDPQLEKGVSDGSRAGA